MMMLLEAYQNTILLARSKDQPVKAALSEVDEIDTKMHKAMKLFQHRGM